MTLPKIQEVFCYHATLKHRKQKTALPSKVRLLVPLVYNRESTDNLRYKIAEYLGQPSQEFNRDHDLYGYTVDSLIKKVAKDSIKNESKSDNRLGAILKRQVKTKKIENRTFTRPANLPPSSNPKLSKQQSLLSVKYESADARTTFEKL